MTIGVGLIGYGLGGRAFHAPYVNATPGMELRVVLSRQADKVLADHPHVKVVDDVDLLLNEPGIDLVVISSPDPLHAEHALKALSAGKHVVVDKPFATRVDDALAIQRMAQDRQLVAAAFHNRRWDADFLTLRRMLGEGLLGQVVQFESHFDRWRPQTAATWKEARPGGAWLDLGPHLVDQALALFGPPLGVWADMGELRSGAPAPDYFHAVLRYSGMRAILHSSKLVRDNGLRFAVHGTGGSWIKHGLDPQEAAVLAGQLPGRSSDWGHDPQQGLFTSAEASTPRPIPNEAGDYPAFWRQLAAAVAGEGASPVPAAEAVAVMQILEAGMESSARRCEIPVPSLAGDLI